MSVHNPSLRKFLSVQGRTVKRFVSGFSPLPQSPLSDILSPYTMPFIWSPRHTQEDYRRPALTAVLMRSGTSKGLFVHKTDLPASREEWGPILLSAMGSACGDKRQLDGVGGGTSTTSKVAVVEKSKRPDADVEYTFAQIAVGSQKIDMSGNCGNIASGVAPFALDEGLVTAKPGEDEVSYWI